MESSIKEFRNDPDRFNEVRNKTLKWALPTIFFSMALGVAFPVYMIRNFNILTFGIFILLLLAIFIIAVYLGLYRLRQAYDSYKLIIGNGAITKAQFNMLPITISQGEIKKIVKKANGSILIKTHNPLLYIAVPAQLQNYNEMEGLINQLLL